MNTNTNTDIINYISTNGTTYQHTFNENSDNVCYRNNKYHLCCRCHLVIFSWTEGKRFEAIRNFYEYHNIDM